MGVTCKNVFPAKGGNHFSINKHDKGHPFRKVALGRLRVGSISPLIGSMLAPLYPLVGPGWGPSAPMDDKCAQVTSEDAILEELTVPEKGDMRGPRSDGRGKRSPKGLCWTPLEGWKG